MDLMRWIQISSNLPFPLTVSYEYAIVFFSGIRRLLDEICNGKRVDEWVLDCVIVEGRNCGGEEDVLEHPNIHAIHMLQRIKHALHPLPHSYDINCNLPHKLQRDFLNSTKYSKNQSAATPGFEKTRVLPFPVDFRLKTKI
ncbi:hypothetical protein ACMD2_20538 [Ananas comosus]|uniref:Uncharacterized protein n=1 Tax=Ananas comosus TaxID=4615 RepID=A0A199UI19_ANACO|nr:hypothetical protein ACMD2_20538 [Ananas comosus]